ncbi:lasso peptide biosynthesis B2 protein [Congregibacter variabilis]|uniref:lasso peptide biosynthesis B2 protein n=1 Tax=Congregibacter variabilis TaxID=3081200 RepID=UPI0038910E6D
MATKLAKLLSLAPGDLGLFAKAWCLFAYVDWVVSRRSYESWPDWMRVEPPKVKSRLVVAECDVPKAISRIIRLSEAAGRRHLREMNCLRRCLVQRRLLGLEGIPTVLQIGVIRVDGALKAHSWLSSAQVPINDSVDNLSQYTALAENDNRIIDALF